MYDNKKPRVGIILRKPHVANLAFLAGIASPAPGRRRTESAKYRGHRPIQLKL